jgi:hypothetical protein
MRADAYPPARVAETVGKLIESGFADPRAFVGMIREFDKPAGERCQYQRAGKGCTIYSRRPFGCRFWNCRWLVNDDTAELRRPDRSHYVIDLVPDFITTRNNETGEVRHVQCVQIWVDPNHPDSHRDPALRAYVERRAKDGIVALIRYSNRDGFVLIPPRLASDGQWHEVTTALRDKEHTAAQVVAALGGA